MPLSCSCDAGGDYDWYYDVPSDYTELETKRSRKCKSCRKRIAVGDVCTEFTRTRGAKNEIEERIYGEGSDAVPLASQYLCEECSDLWFNLDALGFKCVAPDENMKQLVREYASMEWKG